MDSAASWSWAAAQPSLPRFSEAVSTASGRPPRVVRACACSKTLGDHGDLVATVAERARRSSSWRRPRRGVLGAGRWEAARSPAQAHPRQGGQERQAAPHHGVLAGVGRDAVNCWGLELSSSTMPATCSGYCAAYVMA